jgi:hypothetical protein
MKRFPALSIIAALVAAQLAPPASFAQRGSGAAIGVNAAIKNIVQMKTAKDGALRPAVLREAVHIGDTVSSGPNSALQVLLRDQSVFTIGANARMTIDRFVYDPARGTGAVAASVARGAFRFMSGRAAHNGGVAIQTPVASIGVRGTIVEVLVGEEAISVINGNAGLRGQAIGADANTATLIVLRGPGPNRVGQDRVGAIDITANGRTTSVNSAGVVVIKGPNADASQTFELTPAIEQRLDSSLTTSPTPQDQRAVVAEIATSLDAALAGNPDEIAAALSRVVLDYQGSPAALQAALARVGAGLNPNSNAFAALMQLSFLVMASTNTPAVGSLGREIASDRGRALVATLADGPRPTLQDAVATLATNRAASVTPRDPATTAGLRDTLAVQTVPSSEREPTIASPS